MIYWFSLWTMQASSSHKIEAFTTFHQMSIPQLLFLVTTSSIVSIGTMEKISSIIRALFKFGKKPIKTRRWGQKWDFGRSPF